MAIGFLALKRKRQLDRYVFIYVTVNLSNSIGLIHSGKNPVNIRNLCCLSVLILTEMFSVNIGKIDTT
jgi:hypothetical protein